MRMASSSEGRPRWKPPIPTIDTFSPVRPNVRWGMGASAACETLVVRVEKTPTAAVFLRKSRRSITNLLSFDAQTLIGFNLRQALASGLLNPRRRLHRQSNFHGSDAPADCILHTHAQRRCRDRNIHLLT